MKCDSFRKNKSLKPKVRTELQAVQLMNQNQRLWDQSKRSGYTLDIAKKGLKKQF
jgi:hypothetical protein